MANFCLNVNNFSEEHKKALETLINVVKDYGFTEAAARIKVFSYIEELSEKYFIKEANKYDTEKAVEQIMQDIAKLSKPEKIGKKIISDIIDLKPVNNLNTVQTIISPKPFISNNEKKIESKTLYITRPKRDGSYNSAYSDYLAFKNEDKENIIQYNSKDGVDNFILKIKELMLSGKYTNLKIASDLGSFDPNFYKAIMSKEFENKAFPTKEEISENITKLRLTSIGYKPKGVLYSIIKGQNSEGLLRERKVYFYSMQHKMLWESMCRIRDRKFNKQQVQESYDRMFKGEPNLTNRDVDRMNYFIYQLETLQEPKDELDYYESGYDENGNFLESTQLKISNIRKEFINYKGYNKGQKQYLERVLKYELSRYTNPGDKLNDSYKTMLIHAITKDKAALQSLKLTGYNKLLYGNTENFHTIILTKLRDIVRMDSNYAQYKYTSIDTDPEQPLNTLNTLAFKIANLKAVPKYDFPTNIHFENQSKLTETYSAKEIADLVEATAARIDFWLSSLQGDDPRAYAYRKSYFTAIKEGKIKAVLGDIAKEEEQQVLENLTDSFINQKLHNYKNYTPEMWIQDLGGLEAFMQLVYKYDLGPNSLRYPIEKLIMDKNERDLIAKRRESVLQRMTPDLFKEIFQMAINKSISLSNFVIDRNYEDFSIEESESEEIEDIEESGWADPGINKPAFITKTSSTVSQEVKSFLSCIKVYNADGTISVDITGFPKLLSFTSAYGKIQEICGNILITTHEDIINELKKHYDTEPWLKQVVLMIEKDSKMAAKFVAAFNVDFIPSVGISRKGEVSLNLKAGAISLKDNWINEIQSGNYDWNSVIFDSNGIINADKVKTVPTLIPRDDIASRLYMVGIKNIPLELLNNLNDYQKKYIEKQINLILVACSKIDKDSANNIIRQASTIYNNIASFLYTYLHVESADASYNVQKNGKIVQQFSYVYNNYLSRISQKIKQLFKTPFTERIKVMENADFISKNPYNFLEDFPIFLYISSVENNEEDVGSIKSITTIEDKEISSVVNEDDYIKSAFYQYIKAMNTVENSNSNSMYYFLPPLSDSGNLLAIKLPIIWNTDNVYYESNSLKKSNEDNPNAVTGKQLLQDLIIHNIFREFCRIKDVSNNKTVLNKVKGYETAGKHFHKLPALDSYINELLTINNNIDVIQRLQEILFNEKDGIITKMTSSFVEKLNTIYKTEIERGKLNDSEFEEFYLNNLLAQWNINDILFTDMAFFKYNGVSSTADFIKRIKGVFGRTTKGDIAQLDNPNCRMAYVKFGIRKKHPMQKYATEILKNSSIANTAEAKVIEKIWQDKIEGADGQGFMTAKGLRAWGKLYGYDSEYIEGFLERAKNQQLTAEDYNFVFSIKKPYVYSQVTDQTSKTQIPTIVKNSLALLIPGLTPPNTIYDALMQFAEEHDLDQIQLDSAVKIGGYNIFDVDSMMEDIPEIGGGNKLFKRMQEAKEKMDNESGLDSIHEIPYEDFGEQTRTETQHDKIKLGIQVMKVMFSDIKNEQAVAAKFNGKDLNGTEYKNVYLSALAAKLNLNYSKVAGIFAQSNTLEHALKSLAISSGKFTMNDLQDIDLSDENVLLGALAPTHLNKYYTLVRGLAKHIAEINVPGKTMIQMSGVAYDEDLHIVFEDVATGTEIISNEANIGTLKDLLKEGKLRIKHIDAYCGVYNNDLYTYLINSETGLIDEEKVNNLPTDVKEFMAYRVPTEGNCSVFPCKIKKFLNRYAGDAIVLPKEIVLLTGSDF
ncbi:MAG: hypothetical protein IJ213_01075, partial [Bacteroidales bacterium]|nr:hypothetical protein [Bacteroidales bacterium]